MIKTNREAFLQQGKVDMVVATYSITPERQKVVSFAGPYYVAHQDILVRANDNSIKQSDDLKGKKVCSGQGSASGDRIEELYGTAVNLIRLPGYGDCVNQLLGGAGPGRHDRQHDPGRFRGPVAEPGQAQGRRHLLQQRDLRNRDQEGRQQGRHRR